MAMKRSENPTVIQETKFNIGCWQLWLKLQQTLSNEENQIDMKFFAGSSPCFYSTRLYQRRACTRPQVNSWREMYESMGFCYLNLLPLVAVRLCRCNVRDELSFLVCQWHHESIDRYWCRMWWWTRKFKYVSWDRENPAVYSHPNFCSIRARLIKFHTRLEFIHGILKCWFWLQCPCTLSIFTDDHPLFSNSFGCLT